MDDAGWTRSYRARWKHPVFRSLLHAAMWAWMTDSAAWRDTTVRFCDRIVTLKRGQLITSERFLAEGFEVNRIVARKLFDTLETANMIVRERAHNGTIITICNYDKYQSCDEDDSPLSIPPESPSVAQAEPRRSPNKEELKNSKKLKTNSIDEPDFLIWYEAYPRKADPGRAAQAYRGARKFASAADLLAAAQRYAAECDGREEKFIKHPTTWLNARAWLNEPAAPALPRPEKTSAATPPAIEPHRQRIEGFRKRGIWPAMFGPKPGERGCTVPDEFLTSQEIAAKYGRPILSEAS